MTGHQMELQRLRKFFVGSPTVAQRMAEKLFWAKSYVVARGLKPMQIGIAYRKG